MHLTRPKSSKGRSRPAVNNSLYAGDPDSIQRPPVSPDSAVHSRPDRNLRSQSQPIMWQASQLSQDEVLQMLQHTPAAPPQSLNKYKVLPSIERRQSEVSPGRSLDKQMSKLSLSDDAILQQRYRHEEPDLPMVKAVTQTSSSEVDKRADMHLRVWPKPPDPGPITTKEAGATGSLLLAIRAPCGRRFQQHFDPTDTLLTVRARAEVMYGAKYGDASIETMDVPRRSFTDMDMTLAQCGILNRSLLCISQNDSVVQHE
ncbi:UBX domain-containing protein 10 [Siniperca chuatsi]|uniref:UBX domain-containing protein 10 n=1 Tax=Siniperca chuatsi TaxID=119488 RepID=UPI001CE11067|nr:UBX domain-containing protein 10 [Siniperca chuatsi]XP_044066746.1 UBX domain-containing protein 10 [Siniperca chuatsi]XP_044066747.1 UBX domain-containing protein 10 [Siniperca chuatsi]